MNGVATLLCALFVARVVRMEGADPWWRLPLFAWHPILLTVATLPLATRALTTVRARVGATAPKPPPGGGGAKAAGGSAKAAGGAKARRALLIAYVKTHFAMTLCGTLAAAGGIGAVWVHKGRLARPHLASLHARTSAIAIALWLGAYALAELRVWEKVVRTWPLQYKPKWLWVSDSHRALGTAATVAALAALATGVSNGYGRRVLGGSGAAVAAANGAIGALALAMALPLTPLQRQRWRRRLRASRKPMNKKPSSS